ncbi:hypothetical protein, partial [Nocardia farcinica]|uniref:hypothetical protein n=1 Tax=Nocardia farcinica TaxID=37329 RepID=UPI0024549218
ARAPPPHIPTPAPPPPPPAAASPPPRPPPPARLICAVQAGSGYLLRSMAWAIQSVSMGAAVL